MNSSVLTMIVAPRGRSRRLAFSAAGFIATSTSGASPGVSTSWSAKCSWKLETPGQGALGGADLGREVGQRRQVVAEGRGLGGEPVTGQLHAVAGVTGEPDDDAVEPLDRLAAHAGDVTRLSLRSTWTQLWRSYLLHGKCGRRQVMPKSA